MIVKMKTIKIDVGDHHFRKMFADAVPVQVEDDATLLHVIAALDEKIIDHPNKPPELMFGAKCVLQLVWDPVSGQVYEDVAVEARTKDNAWIPLLDNPTMVLPDEASVFLWPDAGC